MNDLLYWLKRVWISVQVDKGVKDLMGAEDGECTTQGLDDLDKRCQQYKVQCKVLPAVQGTVQKNVGITRYITEYCQQFK